MRNVRDLTARTVPSFAARKARILIADDHALFTAALAKLLEPEFEVAGKVLDGRALLQQATTLRPDVILLDLSMPLMNGTEAGQRLHTILPQIKIIVVTASEDLARAVQALRTWASAFLLKKAAAEDLIEAIHQVLRGGKYITPEVRRRLQDAFTHGADPESEKQLTPRQREVLQLLAEGHSLKETASILSVALGTVAFHKYKMMEDLGLKTNTDLLRLAIKERLVQTTS